MNKTSVSIFGQLYRHLYNLLCGQSPRELPWHLQWLSILYLCRSLSRLLTGFAGWVLDLRYGDKPFRDWFGEISEYLGLDVVRGPEVGAVITPKQPCHCRICAARKL